MVMMTRRLGGVLSTGDAVEVLPSSVDVIITGNSLFSHPFRAGGNAAHRSKQIIRSCPLGALDTYHREFPLLEDQHPHPPVCPH